MWCKKLYFISDLLKEFMRSLTSFKLVAIAVVMVNVLLVPSSFAATATGVLAVTATVMSTCTVASTPVAFGNYTSTQIDTTGSITVTCTLDVSSYNVALGTGTGATATTATRTLTSAASNTLNYELYRDTGRTLNWGNVSALDTVASTSSTSGIGATKTFTAYARLPAGQTSAAAVYADTVSITVNF